jgi:hypothetical protein
MLKISRPRGVSKFVAGLFSAALLLGAGATAHALSITYNDGNGCGSSTCFGSVYTLTVSAGVPSGGGTLYNVNYAVDTTGYSGGGSGLEAIAFKITDNSSSILGTSITSQPPSFSDPLILGGLSAGGCDSGPAGFICSFSSNTGGIPTGSAYEFKYGVTLANGTLFGDPSQWTLKALYVDQTGKQAGLTSATGGAVPVPGTLLMFGLGFALFIGWHQRSGRRTGRVGLAA